MAHVRTVPRKDGQAYEVVWRQGDQRRQRTFKVKREAERFALKVENEIADGNSTAPLTRNSKTFREVAEACLAADVHRLKPKTFARYEDTLRLHIYPTLGSRRIAAITSQHVEQWVAELRATPKANGKARSESSVRTAFTVLQKIFAYAARHRLITYNPTVAVPKPRNAAYDPNFLTLAEVEAIAKCLDDFPPYGTVVRMAAWTGLRSGELGALRVRDIDLMHKEVRVERTMSWVRGEWIYTAPKSERSRRTVPLLSEDLVSELKGLLADHPHRADPDAGLWPGKVKGHPLATYDRAYDPSGFYRYSFKPAAKAAGHPTLRFHELRHTFASLMASYGVSMFELSRMMGHSSITVTDGTYAHLYKKDYSDLRRRIASGSVDASLKTTSA